MVDESHLYDHVMLGNYLVLHLAMQADQLVLAESQPILYREAWHLCCICESHWHSADFEYDLRAFHSLSAHNDYSGLENGYEAEDGRCSSFLSGFHVSDVLTHPHPEAPNSAIQTTDKSPPF